MELDSNALDAALAQLLSPEDSASIAKAFRDLTSAGSPAPHGVGLTGDLLAYLAIVSPRSVESIIEQLKLDSPIEYTNWIQMKDHLMQQLARSGESEPDSV